MKIIDAHAHIYPDKIAQKVLSSVSGFYDGIDMNHVGSCCELLKSGKQIGVNKYLVFSTATSPNQVESINDFIIGSVNSRDEFIGLGTMHREYKNFADELERIKKNGLNGIKLHPDFQKAEFDAKDLYPVYDALAELNMFVLTHAGDYRYNYSNPEKIARVAKDFPKLNIIAAHFGGWSQWDTAFKCLNLPNVYFDTSSTFGFDAINYAKKAFDVFDNSHIFFATDFPMWDHKQEYDNIKKLGLSDDLFEKVMYKNFFDFYKIYDKNDLF